MALLLNPGKEVIGNGCELEAGLLSTIGIAYQIGRAVFLRHKFVAEFDHRCCPQLATWPPLRPSDAYLNPLGPPAAPSADASFTPLKFTNVSGGRTLPACE